MKRQVDSVSVVAEKVIVSACVFCFLTLYIRSKYDVNPGSTDRSGGVRTQQTQKKAKLVYHTGIDTYFQNLQ